MSKNKSKPTAEKKTGSKPAAKAPKNGAAYHGEPDADAPASAAGAKRKRSISTKDVHILLLTDLAGAQAKLAEIQPSRLIIREALKTVSDLQTSDATKEAFRAVLDKHEKAFGASKARAGKPQIGDTRDLKVQFAKNKAGVVTHAYLRIPAIWPDSTMFRVELGQSGFVGKALEASA